MLRIKPTATFILTVLTITASAQFTDVINSNRPGESMAAFSVGKTVIQAEAGFYASREKYELNGTDAHGLGGDLAVRYGAFFEQLELILELQYQRDKVNVSGPLPNYTQSGMRQMTIGAKYLFYDPNKNYQKKPNLYSWKANHQFSWHDIIPAIGFYGGFNMNLFDSPYFYPNEEKVSPKFMLLTQNQFGRWVVVGNFIVDKIATNYMSLGYVLTLTRGVNERWSWFIENQGYQSDQYSDLTFRGGAAFLIKENIQVDASIGANVKTTPSIIVGGIGLSWRFDANYEDVILRAPKEDKKSKEQKKADKEKAKAKKRVDEVGGEEKTK